MVSNSSLMRLVMLVRLSSWNLVKKAFIFSSMIGYIKGRVD